MSYKVSFDGIEAVNRFFRTADRRFNRAMSYFIGRQVRWMKRDHIMDSIARLLTIRNKRFVETSIRYDRPALGGKSPHVGYVGSIPRSRFTGWAEQEGAKLGGQHGKPRKRVINIGARRGAWKRKAVPQWRHKPARQFEQVPLGVTGSTGKKAVIAALRILSRRREKQPFRIDKGHPKLKPGLYKFKGRAQKNGYRHLQPLQYDSKKKPSREVWMLGAVNSYDRALNPEKEWGRALRFVFHGWKRKV